MKHFTPRFFVKLLILLLVVTTSGWGSIAYYAKRLDTLNTAQDKTKLFDTLYGVPILYKVTALNWLEDKVLNGSDARYAYVYAHNLHINNLDEMAAAALFTAMVTSRVDASRCVDQHTAKQVISQLETTLEAPIFEIYKTFSNEIKSNTIETARLLEGIHATKSLPTHWLCTTIVADDIWQENRRIARDTFWERIQSM